MGKGAEATLTPEFLRRHLAGMAGLALSEEGAGMHELVAGLVALVNGLDLEEGEADLPPALLFRPLEV